MFAHESLIGEMLPDCVYCLVAVAQHIEQDDQADDAVDGDA